MREWVEPEFPGGSISPKSQLVGREVQRKRLCGGGGREGGSPPVCLSTVIRCLWSRSGGLAVGRHCHIRQE